jgi:TPR repeat protein
MSFLKLFFAMLLLGSAISAHAGFDEGNVAYQAEDYDTALKEWQPLAEQGDAWAQFGIGNMYNEGQGVKQDYTEAMKWYRKAAAQGIANASISIAMMYREGKGVKADGVKVRYWVGKAAEQGDIQAQNNVRKMMHIPVDELTEIGSYKAAARDGDINAMERLGKVYENGELGEKRNPQLAKKWYDKAKHALGDD